MTDQQLKQWLAASDEATTLAWRCVGFIEGHYSRRPSAEEWRSLVALARHAADANDRACELGKIATRLPPDPPGVAQPNREVSP